MVVSGYLFQKSGHEDYEISRRYDFVANPSKRNFSDVGYILPPTHGSKRIGSYLQKKASTQDGLMIELFSFRTSAWIYLKTSSNYCLVSSYRDSKRNMAATNVPQNAAICLRDFTNDMDLFMRSWMTVAAFAGVHRETFKADRKLNKCLRALFPRDPKSEEASKKVKKEGYATHGTKFLITAEEREHLVDMVYDLDKKYFDGDLRKLSDIVGCPRG